MVGEDPTMKIYVFAIASLLGLNLVAADIGASPGRVPVVLELFTSEGCSSCPPADRLLEVLDRTQPIDGADLIVLSEHVDYWNRLGWTDPFSSAEYSRRQEEYSRRLRAEGVYTPQLVVDGRAETVGNNVTKVEAKIREAARQPKLPVTLAQPSIDGKRLKVHVEVPALPEGNATVYIAIAENQTTSQVLRGENSGRSLQHVAVVRSLTAIGSVNKNGKFTKDAELPLVSKTGGKLRIVVFVQDRSSWHILGAAQQTTSS